MKVTSQVLTYAEAGWCRNWSQDSAISLPLAQRFRAWDGTRCLSTATLSVLPDDSLSFCFHHATAEGNPDADGTLLAHATKRARLSGARYIRCIGESDELKSQTRVFQNAGYVSAGSAVTAKLEHVCEQPSVSFPAEHADGFSWLRDDTTVVPSIKIRLIRMARSFAGPSGSANVLPSLVVGHDSARFQNRHFDRPRIETLLKSLLRSSHDFQSIPPSSASQLVRLWELLSTDVTLLIAEVNQEPVGLCVYSKQSNRPGSEQATIEYIGVLPTLRRAGIGRRLLWSAIDHPFRDTDSLQPHPWKVEIQVTYDSCNSAANALYDSLGFSKHTESAVWFRLLQGNAGTTS